MRALLGTPNDGYACFYGRA